MKTWCKKFITSQNIKIAILFIPLVILFIEECRSGKVNLSTFLDTSVLVSFILVFICDMIATLLSRFIGKKYEDQTKLTINYGMLTQKYCRENLIEYCGKKFPVICLAFRQKEDDKFDMRFCYSGQKYELPQQVAQRSGYIMEAHSFSTVYNAQNVRIDDICADKNRITITYSMTTYFDSLLTNRAMDFPLEDGRTIREIYEPGPFLSPLSKSKLSNHLGFNGFIETADGKIIFVLRHGNVSIGKHTLANSIGASLKTKYCLEPDGRLNRSGISNAIRQEIHDELQLETSEEIDFCDTIFAFYRDIVEGGKPQFLFYYKSDAITSEQFLKTFSAKLREKEIKKKDTVIDGTQIICLSYSELKNCVITPKQLILPNKKAAYSMMPSAAASVVMLLDYLHFDRN